MVHGHYTEVVHAKKLIKWQCKVRMTHFVLLVFFPENVKPLREPESIRKVKLPSLQFR